MEKDGDRICDGCGKPIPKKAMLATKENGKDLCLACQIREAQITKGVRH
jgi:RNA polymerase-binding transcription factor DksA